MSDNKAADDSLNDTAEHHRILEADKGEQPWRLWGPYLSERQWGTVREDYSPNGDAWDYLTHDQARSRAFRWGEDGLAGLSDDRQLMCFSIALWNGRDPYLKERLFGLSNGQGNHGEDVKELYYYLDATPSHAYLKFLYKYPQCRFPYEALIAENAKRSRNEPEFEIVDTGAFADDCYFDVMVEFAKSSAHDISILITVNNRGLEPALLHVLPQLCFRNVWSWRADAIPKRPILCPSDRTAGIEAEHPWLGTYYFACDQAPPLMFTENETNAERVFGATGENGPFKDAFHGAVVSGQADALARPPARGTKAAAHYDLKSIGAGETKTIRLRLARIDQDNPVPDDPFADHAAVFEQRRADADAFFAALQTKLPPDPEARRIHRQALAGMIWSKQTYRYDVRRWLDGDPLKPPPPEQRLRGRNSDWRHLNAIDVLSMPDKWEYPWFAAWDLAFHCVPLARIDPGYAKGQLTLLTREWYMHPNGELPAYEWSFSDVNPPVHAWAAWRVFEIDREQTGGDGDLPFLERTFHKLILNFTWWVNREDAAGRNIFQGGFLGLDNIGVFNRSSPAPCGGVINQADATAWMAMYALNLMRIALELARHNPVYEDLATKFFEHFLLIAEAMEGFGGQDTGLWDDQDEFFYDQLALPDGRSIPLRVRSMVGLIPLFAVEVIEPELLERLPDFAKRLRWTLKHRPELARLVSRWGEKGENQRHLLSLLRGHRMKALLRRMLDETEFLSPYGVRSLSRHYLDHPYVFEGYGGDAQTVTYQAGASNSGMFGGNSNWRGPVWMPVNFLIIEGLRRFAAYYGPEFKVECPTNSGIYVTIDAVADELSRRLSALFLRDGQGRRPCFGDDEKQDLNPHFRDLLLFNEYFDGDTGRGLGASHQTGWTALVAELMRQRDP